MSLEQEIEKRKTFGIISHPDAGKTTLTEKLLLFGGAIQTAGAVKNNKIALIDDPMVLLPTSSMPRIAAAFAKVLHPDLAEEIDNTLGHPQRDPHGTIIPTN